MKASYGKETTLASGKKVSAARRAITRRLVTPQIQAASVGRPASRGPHILPRLALENGMSRPRNPPRVSAKGLCSRPFQMSGIRDLLRRESHPYDLLARTRRQVEAGSHVTPSSHSQPLRYGFSGLLRTGGGSPRSHERARYPRCRRLSGDQSVACAFMAAGR